MTIPQYETSRLREVQVEHGLAARVLEDFAPQLATEHAMEESSRIQTFELATPTIVAIDTLDAEYAAAERQCLSLMAALSRGADAFAQPTKDQVGAVMAVLDAAEANADKLTPPAPVLSARPDEPGWVLMCDELVVDQAPAAERAVFLEEIVRAVVGAASTPRLLELTRDEVGRRMKRARKASARLAAEAKKEGQKRISRAAMNDSGLWPRQADSNQLFASESEKARDAAVQALLADAFQAVVEAAAGSGSAAAYLAKHRAALESEFRRVAQPPDRWLPPYCIELEAVLPQAPAEGGPEVRAAFFGALKAHRDEVAPVARAVFEAALRGVRSVSWDIGAALRESVRLSAIGAGQDPLDEEEARYRVQDRVAAFVQANAERAEAILTRTRGERLFAFHASPTGLPFDEEATGVRPVFAPSAAGMLIFVNLYRYALEDLRFFEQGIAELRAASEEDGYYARPDWMRPAVIREAALVVGAADQAYGGGPSMGG